MGEEDVFSGFLERFPAGRFTLLFAVDEAETVECLETGEAFLVVVDLERLGPALGQALRQARHAGSVVLGLAPASKGPPQWDLADWRVQRDAGIEVIATAALEILEERRRSPRAAAQLPVTLGTMQATATVVSACSVFVPTARPYEVGEVLEVTLDAGPSAPPPFPGTAASAPTGPGGAPAAATSSAVVDAGDVAPPAYADAVAEALADDEAAGAHGGDAPPADPRASRAVRRVEREAAAREWRHQRRERQAEHVRRAWELVQLREYARARAELTKALQLGDAAPIRDMLALAHQRAGELWPAAHHAERAAALSRGLGRARRLVYLGALYGQLGKRAEACRAYRGALDAVPGYAAAQRAVAASCPGGARAHAP